MVAVLAIWQRDNIKALYMGITNDEKALAEKREENDKIITDTLDKYPELTVRDLIEEEKKALAEGKITNEEALLIIQGKTTLEELLQDNVPEPPAEIPEEPEAPAVTPDTPPEVPAVTPEEPEKPAVTPAPNPEIPPAVTPEPEPETPSADEEISSLVAQMYVLKSEFTAALKNLENTTLKDYAALSNEEKTAEVKTKMMNEVLDTVAAMEKDCDTKVNAILEKLTALLTESGKELTLVESIRAAYKNEKTITKAEYINTYFK
ncbi:MAG: hypothetical protein IJ323_01850 [Clostridia bacterium]|nr:hypothetical protein [Clostridia bacterium]